MESEISQTCLFLSTAKEVWDAVHQTYSRVRDAAQIYEIKTRISGFKQGSKSVTEYSTAMKSLWLELDHSRSIKMKCSEDVAILKRFMEQERVYEYLAGLDPKFDQVRSQILGKDNFSR